jgi:hypothetical protein
LKIFDLGIRQFWVKAGLLKRRAGAKLLLSFSNPNKAIKASPSYQHPTPYFVARQILMYVCRVTVVCQRQALQHFIPQNKYCI